MSISERLKRIENSLLIPVYRKRGPVLVSGRGCWVRDIDGREYLDVTSGFGVAILGHSHPLIIEAISSQIEKLITCHSSFYCEARAEFLEAISKRLPSELNSFLLTNSGAEAVEASLKLARKYTGRKKIVAFVRGYHGKTLGALSATWNPKYRKGFEPLVEGFLHLPYGNLERVESFLRENAEDVASIIVEPIQGEGGINVPPPGFLKGLRELADQFNVLLIVDEIQTGLMRTGTFLASEQENVVPDILLLGKGLGGGLPIGFLASRKDVGEKMGIGGHTSTMAGNPVVCASGKALLEALSKEVSSSRIESSSKLFFENLTRIAESSNFIREVRGKGLMIGIECRKPVGNLLKIMEEKGVLALNAGINVVRFLPPLIINRDEILKVCETLEESVKLVEEA
ncbi:aspartate aminotransferase family protein [archaeon]|nr:MAG: aspartate aminotransferase family protein [archaeon]